MAAKTKREEWGVEYFKRHKADPGEAVPGREFLGSCPLKV
jgi:hypothetical protein